MPLPIFLIDFHRQHGRDPRLDEMTAEQRQMLLRCADENERINADTAGLREEAKRSLQELHGVASRIKALLAKEPSLTAEQLVNLVLPSDALRSLREMCQEMPVEMLRRIAGEGPKGASVKDIAELVGSAHVQLLSQVDKQDAPVSKN